MKTIRTLSSFLLLFLVCTPARADDLARREWKIDDVTREALVHVPVTAQTKVAPVVFAFHGHGGSMQNAVRMFGYHTVWPEAIVVYMQGLNTPGQLTDPEGKKPGWQKTIGDQNDRDLHFFDAVLASLKKDYKVDSKRIYSTGHSNGGGFTYLLWAARGEQFAAFAPSAAVGRTLVEHDRSLVREVIRSRRVSGEPSGNTDDGAVEAKRPAFVPKPVLHVAGENDPLVKFAWQERMINELRKRNQCGEARPWDADKRCKIYPSQLNAPVVTYITQGTHKFPDTAPEIIVKFFKEHSQP